MIKCCKPYFDGFNWFPCGSCVICKHNRQQDWVTRLEIESLAYNPEDILYTTLSYAPEYLPEKSNLKYDDVQRFLKRLRKALTPYGIRFRYFCCGEYGSKFLRPHYHMIIFGLPPTLWHLVTEIWYLGNVKNLPLKKGAFSYVCGYLNKKHTKRSEYRLIGKVPEMVHMSQGIGKKGIPALMEFLKQDITRDYDVIKEFVLNGRKVRMPRYLVKRLREKLFTPEHIENLKSVYYEVMMQELNRETLKLFYDELKDSLNIDIKGCPPYYIRKTIEHYAEPRALKISFWNQQQLLKRKLH